MGHCYDSFQPGLHGAGVSEPQPNSSSYYMVPRSHTVHLQYVFTSRGAFLVPMESRVSIQLEFRVKHTNCLLNEQSLVQMFILSGKCLEGMKQPQKSAGPVSSRRKSPLYKFKVKKEKAQLKIAQTIKEVIGFVTCRGRRRAGLPWLSGGYGWCFLSLCS